MNNESFKLFTKNYYLENNLTIKNEKMKKIYTITSLFFMTILFSNNILSQISGTLYYGAPNILPAGAILTDDYVGEVYSTQDDIDWSNLGPLGLHVAYRGDGKVSFGLDLNYSTTSATFNYNAWSDLSFDTYDNVMDAKRSIVRAMLRVDGNWGSSDVFVPFTGIGVGFRSASNTFTSTRAGFEQTEDTTNPLAFRVHAGANIFFIDNFALLVEAGFGGGGLVRFGLTYKM